MSTVDAPERSDSPRGSLLTLYPLTSFFVMAFAFSWIAWSPWFLSEDGAGLLPFRSPLINGLVVPVGILLALTRSWAEKAWLTQPDHTHYVAKVTPLKRKLVIGCLQWTNETASPIPVGSDRRGVFYWTRASN